MNLKKLLVVGVIVLFLGLAIAPSINANVKQITMPTAKGDTLYVGGSGEGNYTKIQDAIDDAIDGDTVYVYAYSSPYYENVVVDKSINLVGEDRDTTIIDGNDTVDVVYVSADWVNISGFKIRNISYNPFAGMGIIIDSNYCTITGNIISDIDSIGIFLSNSNSNTITGNTISNNYDGIWLDYSDSNTINDNNISENNVGIYLSNSNSNTITGNSIISHNVYGIELYGSNNTITGNIISNNLFGIVLSNSVFNTILKNNFLDNEQDASFITSILNQWKQNYWNEPRILPKLIFGLIIIGSILIPWFNFDWSPASEPYDIGV